MKFTAIRDCGRGCGWSARFVRTITDGGPAMRRRMNRALEYASYKHENRCVYIGPFVIPRDFAHTPRGLRA